MSDPTELASAVRAALDILKPPLLSFILTRLREVYGPLATSREPRLQGRSTPDSQALLSILLDHWQAVFGQNLKPSHRSIVHELKAARNLWAHEEPISWDQAYRCVDNVQVLLEVMRIPSEVARVERIKRQLRGLGADTPAEAGGVVQPVISIPQPRHEVVNPTPSRQVQERPGVYETFRAFVEAEVLPMSESNPGAIRLDGRSAGGNRSAAGRFRHAGRTWRVNADTHLEPLLLAYHSAGPDPFVEVQSGSGRQLHLTPDLQRTRASSYKNLYIYEETPRGGAAMKRRGSDTHGTAEEGRRLVTEALSQRGAEVEQLRMGNSVVLRVLLPGSSVPATVRVKTRRSGTWQGKVGDGDPDPPTAPNDWWIFVSLEGSAPEFFVVPDAWIRRNVYEHHEAYLAKHGGKRAVTADSDHHAIQPWRLEEWQERWDLLGLAPRG